MTFYVTTKSLAKKRHFLWAVQKRQIRVFQNDFVRDFVLCFFHRSQKISFLRETFCANIKCHDVYPKFYLIFLLTF